MKLGKYKHYKGGLYNVIAIAKHSETMEDMVVYVSDKGSYWVRPKIMFLENVTINNNIIPRFIKIEDNE